MMISAITGGIAGAALSLAGAHGLAQAVASYALGGIVAVTGLLAMALTRQGFSAADPL